MRLKFSIRQIVQVDDVWYKSIAFVSKLTLFKDYVDESIKTVPLISMFPSLVHFIGPLSSSVN